MSRLRLQLPEEDCLSGGTAVCLVRTSCRRKRRGRAVPRRPSAGAAAKGAKGDRTRGTTQARGGPCPRGIETPPAEEKAMSRELAALDAGMGGPPPSPTRPFSSPFTPSKLTFRGGRAPPQIHGGRGRRAEGRMPDLFGHEGRGTHTGPSQPA